MLRLARYVKPYWLLVVLTIALLFVQANADLALPDYMSRIVNNGIQQGGIENAVPKAIRETEMARLEIFLSAENKALIRGDYTLITKDSPDYATYLKDYPVLATQPVYVLKAVDQAEITKLNPIMGKALVTVYSIEQMVANPTRVQVTPTPAPNAAANPCGTGASGSTGGFDLSKLPAGVDPFTLLAKAPPAALSQITCVIDQKFAALGDNMITQSAAAPIKAEYTALGMDAAKLQNNYIFTTGGIMLLFSLLSVICTIFVGFFSARAAAGMARDLRKDVFKKVESFSNVEFDKFSTASLITRSTNDITQIQMVVIMMMRMIFYAPIMGVGGIIRAMAKDVSMWWIIALAVAILITLIITVFNISLPKFKIIQSLIDRLNLVTRENLSGMMVIRAFNMQGFEEDRFDKANKDLTSTNLFVTRVMVVMMPMMMLIMNGVTLLILWVGAHQVAESHMQVGDMMAFMQYAIQIVFSFFFMSFMFIMLPRAAVSANRIADVIETEVLIKDPPAPVKFNEPFTGLVEFRNVCFRYPNAQEDVLHDISFTVRPGQTTAIIGPTGSGKSTIIGLIPRFYEITGGSLLVDNVDIRQVTQHDLRNKIGFIPQKSMLFSGTIESNLRYADQNASEEAIKDATEIAQANEFIFARPEGLAAEIAQGGANVSGGQKQRLAIARALVKKPPIFIFDDSFSALDFRTDVSLRRALKEKTGSSAVIIVTQRISTIKNADQIVVLDEGKVVGLGRHAELMENCGTYREIALSQLSMEELS